MGLNAINFCQRPSVHAILMKSVVALYYSAAAKQLIGLSVFSLDFAHPLVIHSGTFADDAQPAASRAGLLTQLKTDLNLATPSS